MKMALTGSNWASLVLRLWRIFLQCRGPRLDLCVRKIPWRKGWLPTPVFLPGEVHGQRSLCHSYRSLSLDQILSFDLAWLMLLTKLPGWNPDWWWELGKMKTENPPLLCLLGGWPARSPFPLKALGSGFSSLRSIWVARQLRGGLLVE